MLLRVRGGGRHTAQSRQVAPDATRDEVSLYPSIGNWSLPCQSHCWIEAGKVQWSYAFTQAQIRATQACDRLDAARVEAPPLAPPAPFQEALLQRVYRWFARWIGLKRG